MLGKTVLKGSYIALSILCIFGMFQVVPKVINYCSKNVGVICEGYQVIMNDPSHKNIAAMQDKVYKLTNTFQVPEWIKAISISPEAMDIMTDDERFVEVMCEALPEDVTNYFLNGEIFGINLTDGFENMKSHITVKEGE